MVSRMPERLRPPTLGACAGSPEGPSHEEVRPMAAWRPDPTFYPSPRLAAQGPPERLAYVATMNPAAAFPSGDGAADGAARPDALVVADVDPASPTYGQLVGRADMPHTG